VNGLRAEARGNLVVAICAKALTPTLSQESGSQTAPTACLTVFSSGAYSLCVQTFKPVTPLLYHYYWCACTLASRQREAAGRNLRVCQKIV